MNYLNKLGAESYYEKPFREVVNLLLENGAFHILKEEWDSFLQSVHSIEHFDIEMVNPSGNTHYINEKIKKGIDFDRWCSALSKIEFAEEVANLPYLKFSKKVLNEISLYVISKMDKASPGSTMYGFGILEEYEGLLISCLNVKEKKKLTKKYLKRLAKEVYHFCVHDDFVYLNDKTVTDKKTLIFLIENYYTEFMLTLGNYSTDELDEAYEEGISEVYSSEIRDLKTDVVAYFTSFRCGKPSIQNYKSAESFVLLYDLLNIIDYLKDELKKIGQLILTKKDASGSNYSLKNVTNKENRFPLVFKNAFSCELFLYSLSFHLNPKPIIFSYYFKIFKRLKYFKRNIKPSDYLAFVNNVYGLTEIRIRKELHNQKEDYYINNLINTEKEFELKTSIKSAI